MKYAKHILAVVAVFLAACAPLITGNTSKVDPPKIVQNMPALTVKGRPAWHFEKPKLQDVMARKDAAQVLDAKGHVKREGSHVHPHPKYYVRQSNGSIVELDADTSQPQGIATVGATAPPITWYTPAIPSDFGPTIDVSNNPLWSVPAQEKEVWQGQNGTCYQLVVYQSALREKPGWVKSSDVIARQADGTVTIIYRRDPAHPVGVRLDNRVSSLDSRLNPTTGACAIPLFERGYDFFRTFNATTKVSTNTRASTNFGWMGSVMTDFGIPNLAIYPSQTTAQTALMAAMASDQLVTCCTVPSPTSGIVIGAHAYSILSIQVENGVTYVYLRNPWGFDGNGLNDGNTDDGIVKETWAQWGKDMSAACISTAWPANVTLWTDTTPPPPVVIVPGDANGDGKVNFADYTILSNHYGQATNNGAADGDFNGDKVVNFADFVILSNNYGKGDATAGAVPPEPKVASAINFTLTKPASGGTFTVDATDPNNLVVSGTGAVPLAFTTDADSVVQTSPGNAPITLSLKNGAYDGWISTIPATAVKFTFTATKGTNTLVKTITLTPTAPPETQPAPTTKKASIILYEDGTWAPAPK